MPELPEVETVMRGLTPVMYDQTIQNVWCGEKGLRFPFPEDLAGRIVQNRVTSLTRRAKYILIHLSNARILAIHLGMSGRIRIIAPDQNSAPEIHDHFSLTLGDGHRIILNDARRFGMIFDLSVEELDVHKSFTHLGLEPLSKDFNPAYLQTKFLNKKMPVKSAIMDQRLVVGVGNIYACEALYRSKISPQRLAGRLGAQDIETLIIYIKEVLQEAIEAGGSTLKDHRLPDGNFGYFQQSLFVYGREGQACLAEACEAQIERIQQAGRSTFYCPLCQK